jgi:hypothetical protein
MTASSLIYLILLYYMIVFHFLRQNQGFWSLLRSWLRPHRGISQDKLPLYLGFFEREGRRGFPAMTNRVVEFIHNARARGKTLLPSLLERAFGNNFNVLLKRDNHSHYENSHFLRDVL